MKTRVYTYLRVSGKGQVDGDGFPRQRESVTRYARRNRMEIVTEFRDEGVCGALFDRPGLTELFVAIKADGVRTVLVEKADRLARDLIVSETLLAEFRKLGVKVVAAEGGTDLTVDNDDPSRKMIRQILGVVSEWEKSCIVQKLRAARIRSKEKNGRCEGQKPYGQKDGESEVVAKIQELRAERLTINEIVERLIGARGHGQNWWGPANHCQSLRMRTNIYDRRNSVIGWTLETSHQIQIFDRTGRFLGYYLKSSDTTHTTHSFFGWEGESSG